MRNLDSIIGGEDEALAIRRRGRKIHQLLVAGLPQHRHIQDPTKLNVNQLAIALNISRQAVNHWFLRGKLSPNQIVKLTQLPGSTLTYEQLIPFSIKQDS